MVFVQFIDEIMCEMKKYLIAGLVSLAAVSALVVFPVNKSHADNENGGNVTSTQSEMGIGHAVKAIEQSQGEDKGIGSIVSAIARGRSDSEDNNSTQESVTMNANGDFKVTGVKVNSVASSTNTVNVSFYGFSRDINLGNAKLIAGGNTIAIGDIQAGDILSASGNFNESTHIIAVSQVNDISYQQKNVSNIQQQIDNILQMIRDLQAQLSSQQGQ